MKKLLYVIGILTLINTVLIIALLTNKVEVISPSLGGTSHLGGLELSETLTVASSSTVAGHLQSDGGFFIGGRYDYGEEPSVSLGPAQICDYNLVTIDPDYQDDTGASLSFPDDETVTGYCDSLSAVGDMHDFYIINTATSGSFYVDIVTGSFDWNMASRSIHNYNYVIEPMMILPIKVLNRDGSSLSWLFGDIASLTQPD